MCPLESQAKCKTGEGTLPGGIDLGTSKRKNILAAQG
jgi:hypothetical protein